MISIKTLLCSGFVLLISFSAGVPAIQPGFRAPESGRQTYIVQFADPPLAVYDGGETFFGERFPATTAKAADGFTPQSPASQAYLAYLGRARERILGAFDLATKVAVRPENVYKYAFNGVALELTSQQAHQLAQVPGVADVLVQGWSYPTTDAGPMWIGAGEVWTGTAPGSQLGNQGEGVIIGIIDSGITPGHPSFADLGGDNYDHQNPRNGFLGLCASNKADCNDKLIGIYDFTQEETNGRDTTGHGTHVASIAAGNHVSARLDANTRLDLNIEISGVAPHANIISYKACQSKNVNLNLEEGCPPAALLDAIDRAVADRVDVINYSIGSLVTRISPWNDPISQAMRVARNAGVFIAVSAGNGGPRPGTVSLPATAPWVMSVANSTHNRRFINKLFNFSGGEPPVPDTLVGVGFTSGYGPKPIVHAGDFGSRLCGTGNDIDFPPDGSSNPFEDNTFHGEIVVCDRGTYARVTKGYNLLQAGAGGMVLANTEGDGESIVSDDHFLPAVHLGFSDSEKLRAWLETEGEHSAEISGATRDLSAEYADIVTASSSRGPAPLAESALKPDVTAPGTNILGAAPPAPAQSGDQFQILTGTSMSSPHVAGAAALLLNRHSTWTPTEVKSALMMTAVDSGLRDSTDATATALDVGAGRVDVSRAINSGLLMNENDFSRQNNPQRLNLPSLANAACFLECSWQRTVSAAKPGITWDVVVEAPEGIELSVTPQSFTLAGVNDTRQLQISADVRNGTVGEWSFGSIRLIPSGGGVSVPEAHLPLAVFVAGGELPEDVSITTEKARGWETITLDGLASLPAATFNAYGLVKGNTGSRRIAEDPSNRDPYDDEGGTIVRLERVRNGDKLLLAEVLSSSARDIDLYVGFDTNGNGQPDVSEEVCFSASPDATERCVIKHPLVGRYWVLIQNWRASGSGRDNVSFVTAVVPDSGASLTATGPGQVDAREEFQVRLSWREGAMHSGSVWYGAVGVGTDPGHPDNVGLLPVIIERDGLAHRPVVLAPGETLQFTLQPGTSHDGIYINVPPNASRLIAVLESQGSNVDLYARQGEPVAGDTPTELQNNAHAFAATNGQREELVIDLDSGQAPARWFITPFLPAGEQTTFSLTLSVEGFNAITEPLQGLWFNPDRQGHGIEFNRQGNIRYVLWYTYLENGLPAWYIASASAQVGNIWVAPLRRFVWDGETGYPTQVGQLIITFESPSEVVFSWRLFGESGSEDFVHAKGVLFPEAEPAVNHTGGWFVPTESGWGDTVITRGSVVMHTLFLYDQAGVPRWVQGVDTTSEDGSPIELFAFSQGFCPVCEHSNPVPESVGEITARFDSQTTGHFDVDVTFPPPYGGTWLRENVPVEMLSQPVE